VMGWVATPDSKSRKRTVCPLGQLSSMRRVGPIGAGNVLLSPQLAGIENGISLIGLYSVEYSMKTGGSKRYTISDV